MINIYPSRQDVGPMLVQCRVNIVNCCPTLCHCLVSDETGIKYFWYFFCTLQATSLNCSHSFCELCLEQWMALKKECPVCRAAITSQMRSIVLDSYIDRMIQQLNPEMKERREELVKERKGGRVFFFHAQYFIMAEIFLKPRLLHVYRL